MKSKSFDLKKSPGDSGKHKTYDFVGYYKTIETSKLGAKLMSDETATKESTSELKNKATTPKRDRSLNKKKNETVDISLINIEGQSLLPSTGRSSPVGKGQHTSTPYSTSKGVNKEPKVKSIMKNSSMADDTTDGHSLDGSYKPKKRNKSVSFMRDENEEVAVKKSKSDDSLEQDKIKAAKKKAKSMKADLKKLKKYKKQMQAEKENNAETNTATEQTTNQTGDMTKKSKKKSDKIRSQMDTTADLDSQVEREKKKKIKKLKKQKQTDESSAPTESETNNNEAEHKVKKKKRQSKFTASDTTETEGEPAKKSRKKEIKPEIVAEDLENLTIGDNPHTLTNLLDEMTVVDKEKKKKNKLRRKNKSPVVSNSEATDLEKIEEGKEKIKWKKRKWNKDKRGEADNKLATTVIVDNLPLAMMMEYKKVLIEHFVKYGLIQRIGVAEMYPTDDLNPVFTTTVRFYSEGAAEKALEQPTTTINGSLVRLSRPLPPVQTTLVVRSYAELTEQAISSLFSAAGRVRSIRVMVKGKKSMATAFVELDGPEAVARAIKLATDARVGGKRIHVTRYELRGARKKTKTDGDNDNDGDSEDYNVD